MKGKRKDEFGQSSPWSYPFLSWLTQITDAFVAEITNVTMASKSATYRLLIGAFGLSASNPQRLEADPHEQNSSRTALSHHI